jgi:hypothetical protein
MFRVELDGGWTDGKSWRESSGRLSGWRGEGESAVMLRKISSEAGTSD